MDLRTIQLDRSLKQNLSQQLFQALRQQILNQQLPAGSRLPSSRQLAIDLGVSRNTINSAIEQLRSQGYLQSRMGSGVYICADLPQKDQPLISCESKPLTQWPDASNYAQGLASAVKSSPNHNQPFTLGLPDTKAFPTAIWQQLLRRHGDRPALMGYHHQQGYQPLRQALAKYLNSSRGLRCTASQIIITQGAQQALALCAKLLCNPGDTALIENPGYIGARKAFMSEGAKLKTIPLSRNGLDISKLPTRSNDSPSFLYCTPTHQYPLGGILPAAERLQLLHWAEQNRCWIIEDDYDSEFHYYSQPIAAMAGMAAETPVIYMGSFSKTLSPGIRLGYLVVPDHLVAAFTEAKEFNSGESPLLTQAVIADFIEEGHFVRHLRRMRSLYQKKWEHMRELCEQYLNDSMTPIAQSAGMHLALEFKDQSLDDTKITVALSARGFGSSPLSGYYHGDTSRKGLALGFANTSEQERIDGIKCLTSLLK